MREGLPQDHGLAKEILSIPALVPSTEGTPLLTDIQYEALAHGVARGESVIVSAPTSTGKTLIGLWAIAASILTQRRAVYLVSHRALAHQKFGELLSVFGRTILEDHSTLVIATGDGVEDALGRRISNPLHSGVLVATYEKFLHSLAVGGPPRDLSDVCLVCDEIQLIGDQQRASNVELLLTLLKRAQWNQFVGLSAVLSPRDAEELSSWLGVVRKACKDDLGSDRQYGDMQGIDVLDVPRTGTRDIVVDNEGLCGDHIAGANCSNRVAT